MKYLLVLLLLLCVAALPPFVEDEIVTTIVLGDNADVKDIIEASNVAVYLQSYATKPRSGLSVQESDVDDFSNGVYIIIGLFDNVNYLQELYPGVRPEGPFIDNKNNVWVISGRTQSDVSTATSEFINGVRSLGSLEVINSESEKNSQQDAVDQEPEEILPDRLIDEKVTDLEDEKITEQQVIIPEPVIEDNTRDSDIKLCSERTVCESEDLVLIRSDCSRVTIKVCEYSCVDGACTKPLLVRLLDWLIFWD